MGNTLAITKTELTRADIDPNRMYTAAELAPLLRVGERTVRKYCTESVFENAVKIAGGRRWLIPGSDIVAMLPLGTGVPSQPDAATGEKFMTVLGSIPPDLATKFIAYYVDGTEVNGDDAPATGGRLSGALKALRKAAKRLHGS